MTYEGRPLRVAILSGATEVWGAQESLLAIAPALGDAGVALQLWSPRGELADRWCGLGLPWHATEFGGPASLADVRGQSAGMRATLAAVVRNARYAADAMRVADVVHSYTMWLHPSVGLAARGVARPAVLDLHETIRSNPGRRLCSVAVRAAGRAIANSTVVRGQLTPAARRRTTVVTRALDLNRFPARSRTHSPDDPMRVSIVGQIIPAKELEVAVEAVGILNKEREVGAVLHVLGDEPRGSQGYAESLRAIARRGHVPLEFAGKRNDVADALSESDVLISCSRSEALGRTMFEGQALGLPVIGVRGSGAEDVIEDHVSGRLFSPGDAPGLARILHEIWSDPARASALGSRGQMRARSAHAPAAVAASTMEVYSSVRDLRSRYARSRRHRRP